MNVIVFVNTKCNIHFFEKWFLKLRKRKSYERCPILRQIYENAKMEKGIGKAAV